MDGSKKSSNILKALPSFYGSKKSNSSQLSVKDKRYNQQVEKALSSFDSLEEWADYIAFLSRLQRALQLSDDGKTHNTVQWIPHSFEVANRLSFCLSSKLPNGVHQKALGIYQTIFNSVKMETLNSELTIWLPGIMPLLSYCSMQLRPFVIEIYQKSLFPNIYPENFKIIAKPIILSLLPGLEDENAEFFSEILELLDDFKSRLNNDSFFWQSIFLCIIKNPEKRLGALTWCNKRLPVFVTIKDEEGNKLSDEAQACISPESGLLVRMFATAINTSTTFNPASDIIVIRGFFYLLISRLSLESYVLNEVISTKDKEFLIMACAKVTLKKDMSLNRRLWNWLLGPDLDSQHDSRSVTERVEYFEKYGLDLLSQGLSKLIDQESPSTKVDAMKIAVSITMDKWEISQLTTPRIFSPILENCYKYSTNQDISLHSKNFFNAVETSYIWKYINQKILDNNPDESDFLIFILKTFDFNETEMINLHIPLSLLTILLSPRSDDSWIMIFESLYDLVSPKAFSKVDFDPDHSKHTRDQLVYKIESYYNSLTQDGNNESPISGSSLSFHILDRLKSLFIDNLRNPRESSLFSKIICELLHIVPNADSCILKDKNLIDNLLTIPISDVNDADAARQNSLLISFAVAKIYTNISKSLSISENSKMLKILLSNLWTSLISSDPANYQVEVVRIIADLDIICPIHHIEAGLLQLMIESSPRDRVKAFSTLWAHSVSINELDSLLARPLQLLIDTISDGSDSSCIVGDFVKNVFKNGSGNRLLKLLTDPLLYFELLGKFELKETEDLGQFGYYLESLLKVIRIDKKLLKEALTTELVVMDSNKKIELIHINNWSISSYKSLVSSIALKFLQMKLHRGLRENDISLHRYLACVNSCLDILKYTVTGNEPDFVDKFHMLIDICSSYMELPCDSSGEIELTEINFLNCIFHFLKLSEDLNISLNLLHIDEDEKEPFLVKFIIHGIEKAKTSVLLESWISLLTRSLYIFNDSVFSVLLPLNDAIIKQIEHHFDAISQRSKIYRSIEPESLIETLLHGLEDFLSISHSFLATSKMKAQNQSNPNNPESGFLGNVIQGVFQIESPAIRSSEQNKVYSILIAYQDAVKVCYQIWSWADLKPSVLTRSDTSADKSIRFLATKLKFRAKKLLELLIDLERQEVIETLIHVSGSSDLGVKLLNVLSGGRSYLILTHMFNSISSRCNPGSLEEAQKSSLQTSLTPKDISKFLLLYYKSLDGDVIKSIWNTTNQFFKEIISHSENYNLILSDSLSILALISSKLDTNFVDEVKKIKKEVSETFLKVLHLRVTVKITNNTSSRDEATKALDPDQNVNEDDLNVLLNEILKDFKNIITDSDKLSAAVSSVISGSILPQVRGRKVGDLKSSTVDLISLIGQCYPNKTWKSLIFDIFMDNSYFTSRSRCKEWDNIVGLWISSEREKLFELVIKITPSTSSTTTNLFVWNEGAEVENKIFILRRISYLILIKPKDYFLEHLDQLFDRVLYSLGMKCPASYRGEICVLFRVLTLKFSELNLLTRWTIITQELLEIFGYVESRTAKELASLSDNELKLVLNACKLLDQLLILSYDDFNLNEWLFVSSSSEVVSGGQSIAFLSIVDRISDSNKLKLVKDDLINVETPQGDLKPLLYGVHSIKSIGSLRQYFDSLSLINYERTYGLYQIDYDLFESDLHDDLISNSI